MRFNSTSGFSIITIMFFIVILSTIGTSLVAVALKENISVANDLKVKQAYFAAMSACDQATRDIVTGVISAPTTYATHTIGAATIEVLKVELGYTSPPYLLIGSGKPTWKITARARVGDSYRQVEMYRAVAQISGTGSWTGVQPGGIAFRKNQIMFCAESKNFR